MSLSKKPVKPAEPVRIPDVWDAYGKVRADLASEAATIEALPDNLRSILFTMLSDARAAEECESSIAELRKAVNAAMHAHDVCVLAVDKANPPMTHQAALNAVIAANAGRPVDQGRPKNPKPAAALKAAIEELTATRNELQRAQSDFKLLSRARGESIARWVAALPLITPLSVTREHIARDEERRVAIERGEVAPPTEPAPVFKWPLEIARAAKVKKPQQYFGKR